MGERKMDVNFILTVLVAAVAALTATKYVYDNAENLL